MQGYGQQQMSPEQYGQALQAFNVLKQRQDTQQQMNASGNPYAMLGAALSGMVANKFGKYKDTSLTDAGSQLDQYQAQQEAKLARIAEEKALREAAKKRAEKLADTKAQNEFEMRKMMTGKEFDVANRAPVKQAEPSFNDRMLAKLNPKQREAYFNKFAGIEQQGGNELYSKEEQAWLAANPEKASQLKQKKDNDMLGIKDQSISGELRVKLALLDDAEKSLNEYVNAAFVDGDYQEVGSFMGATNAKLQNAMDNVVRIETGAGKSEKEAQESIDKYAPSMWRSDETNADKVKMFRDKINALRAGIRGEDSRVGNQPQQSESQTANQPPVLNAANEILKKRGLL